MNIDATHTHTHTQAHKHTHTEILFCCKNKKIKSSHIWNDKDGFIKPYDK